MAERKKREQIIKDLMEGSNKSREEAEVIAAIELGETDGDNIELEDESDTAGE